MSDQVSPPPTPTILGYQTPQAKSTLAVWIASPLRKEWHWAIVATLAAAWWGLAWLPGGLPLVLVAAGTFLVVGSYGLLRDVARWLILLIDPQLAYPVSKSYHLPKPAGYSILLLIGSVFLINPASVSVFLTQPLFHHYVSTAFAKRPISSSNFDTGFYGPFYVYDLKLTDHDVRLFVRGGQCIRYTPGNILSFSADDGARR